MVVVKNDLSVEWPLRFVVLVESEQIGPRQIRLGSMETASYQNK
jgi:hypothetical protein